MAMIATALKTKRMERATLRPHDVTRKVQKKLRSRFREMVESEGISQTEVVARYNKYAEKHGLAGITTQEVSRLINTPLITIEKAYIIAKAMGWQWQDLFEEI